MTWRLFLLYQVLMCYNYWLSICSLIFHSFHVLQIFFISIFSFIGGACPPHTGRHFENASFEPLFYGLIWNTSFIGFLSM